MRGMGTNRAKEGKGRAVSELLEVRKEQRENYKGVKQGSEGAKQGNKARERSNELQ